jgi:hypothetical protein
MLSATELPLQQTQGGSDWLVGARGDLGPNVQHELSLGLVSAGLAQSYNQSGAVEGTRISCGDRARVRTDGLRHYHQSEGDDGRAYPQRRPNEKGCARCGGIPRSAERPLLDLFCDEP